MRIAILGATGYIGRSLLHECVSRGLDVTPFTRDAVCAASKLRGHGIESLPPCIYTALNDQSFDIVVNAAGIGSPKILAASPLDIFAVTEFMDDILLKYLARHPAVRVFNLSSGAVYGLNANREVADGTIASFVPDRLQQGDSYGIAKLASEAKHRCYSEHSIIDLRVFSFFSRFVDLEDTFLLSDIVNAVCNDSVFKTSADDLMRDYVTAAGLLDLILFFYSRDPTNLACDVQTRAPVTKWELLEYFASDFGLRYEITSKAVPASPTGSKNIYVSRTTSLSRLGFHPRETSLEGVARETRALIATLSVPS